MIESKYILNPYLANEDEEHEEEEPTGAKKKKAKNLLKVMKYHQRTRRVFKQREPMQ